MPIAANDNRAPPPRILLLGFVRDDGRVTFTPAQWRPQAPLDGQVVTFSNDPREA